jgi:hypothetical protein
MTGGDFRSMIFPTQYRVPSYARWLLWEADMAPAYRWHRRYLQHLQSRHGCGRWLLKSPGHLWSLGALMADLKKRAPQANPKVASDLLVKLLG